jgi:histidinol phosphatase-like PHP family hydrolase
MDLGYEYVAVTDHSKGLRIAGGIDEEALAGQGREVDALNDSLASQGRRFRVLRSLELNLRPDGTGDMDPEARGPLDLVLGSFHSSLRVKEDQTDRYLAALENPDINVLGHPRGRMYNFRVGLNADWAVVFERAAEVGKAVEIDCFPYRQDLDVRLLRLARDAGAWCPSERTPTTRWRCSSSRSGSPPPRRQACPRTEY